MARIEEILNALGYGRNVTGTSPSSMFDAAANRDFTGKKGGASYYEEPMSWEEFKYRTGLYKQGDVNSYARRAQDDLNYADAGPPNEYFRGPDGKIRRVPEKLYQKMQSRFKSSPRMAWFTPMDYPNTNIEGSAASRRNLELKKEQQEEEDRQNFQALIAAALRKI